MAARLGFRGLEHARARIQPTASALGLCERSQDRFQPALKPMTVTVAVAVVVESNEKPYFYLDYLPLP